MVAAGLVMIVGAASGGDPIGDHALRNSDWRPARDRFVGRRFPRRNQLTGSFFGVTCLMTVVLLATLVTLPATARPARRVSILESLRTLPAAGLRAVGLDSL